MQLPAHYQVLLLSYKVPCGKDPEVKRFMRLSEADLSGVAGGAPPPPPPPIFCNHLFFCSHPEELQTMLFTVELIINNAPLTYVYLNTIETCLTPNYLFLADSYYNLLTQHHL